MGISIDDLKRTISVLFRPLSIHTARWELRISSCIHSTSVGILVVSFVGTTYRRVMDFRQISFVGDERVIMKGELTILYLMYPTSGSLISSFISVEVLFLHLNV